MQRPASFASGASVLSPGSEAERVAAAMRKAPCAPSRSPQAMRSLAIVDTPLVCLATGSPVRPYGGV